MIFSSSCGLIFLDIICAISQLQSVQIKWFFFSYAKFMGGACLFLGDVLTKDFSIFEEVI